MSTVWVLTVDHRHGRDTWVHATEEGAFGHLADYVSDWWTELVGRNDRVELPDEAPADTREAINTYFETVGDEYYDIESKEVLS